MENITSFVEPVILDGLENTGLVTSPLKIFFIHLRKLLNDVDFRSVN